MVIPILIIVLVVTITVTYTIQILTKSRNAAELHHLTLCKTEARAGARFCHRCGKRVNTEE